MWGQGGQRPCICVIEPRDLPSLATKDPGLYSSSAAKALLGGLRVSQMVGQRYLT